VFFQTSTAPHYQGAATVRPPRDPLGKQDCKVPLPRPRLSDLIVVRIAQLGRLDRAVIALHEYQQVQRPAVSLSTSALSWDAISPEMFAFSAGKPTT
jgi:hypothetical protein